MNGGLQASKIFDDYRKNGEQLQLLIGRMSRCVVKPKYADEVRLHLESAQMTLQNLQLATQYAMQVKSFVEHKFGMDLDSVVEALGGNKDLVRACIFGGLSIVNKRVLELALKLENLERKIGK